MKQQRIRYTGGPRFTVKRSDVNGFDLVGDGHDVSAPDLIEAGINRRMLGQIADAGGTVQLVAVIRMPARWRKR